MRKNSIKSTVILVFLTLAVTLAGCSTTKDSMLSHGDQTMLDIWQTGTGGSANSPHSRQLMDTRQTLRRPITTDDILAAPAMQASYTRTAANEIYSQFSRLPNPDMVMYVYPHLAGSDPVPVPGYSTVFPLYQQVQYAMPGERVEAY